MGKTRKQILEWEARWAVPAALAAFAVIALLIAAQLVSQVSGDGEAEVLRSVNENSGSVAFSGVLRAVAFVLLALPIVYLFRAAQARSDRMRAQLIGLVVAAPLFFAASSGVTIALESEAADQFVMGEAKSTLSRAEAREECVEQRQDEGQEEFAEEFEPEGGESALAACQKREIEDDEASNARSEASLAGLTTGLGVAGGLGLLFAFLYTGLYAMRTGLLTRFWGSLGMAVGFGFLIPPIFLITMLWLLYFGFLLLGAVPGGKPPAWAAGEAIPWPTPGEKAAAELEPEDADAIDVGSTELGPGEGPEGGPTDGGERRKRKRRE